ncbi:MAG: hypothetical protein OEO21_06830 [Candidatus Krumholzibacteria bacterium]|nr:hypothetical protein [Candidatus Krumholzibacteria bacterium]
MKNARDLVRTALLVAGAAVIVVAAVVTVRNLTDRTVLTVLVPGVVVGLILIGGYVAVGRAHREQGD